MAVRLLRTSGTEEQWHAIARPWLAQRAATAWRDPRPTVILTPTRAEGFYLRSRLVADRTSFFALHFWTPSDARAFLTAQLKLPVAPASRADQNLLARACAEQLLAQNPNAHPSFRAVAQEPAGFLRTYDQLLGAGWNPARDGADFARPLARAFETELQQRKLVTQAGLHRQLREISVEKPPALIADLLLLGFNAAHWPLWDLLQAVVASSTEAVVALSNPTSFGEQADQLWLGSWEENFGEAQSPDGSVEMEKIAFADFADAYQEGVTGDASTLDLNFLVAPDPATQHRAVTLQLLDYLARPDCTRLGLVFPEANALALGVADQLRQLGIPFNDGIGAIQPHLFECASWSAWLALLEEPSVATLLAWVRAAEIEKRSPSVELSAVEIADELDRASAETLIDDLDYVALVLESKTNPKPRAVTAFLRQRATLAAEGSFAAFFATTQSALRRLGWNDFLELLPPAPPAWLCENDLKISRRAFLAWLREISDTRERTRQGQNHFYGKVHLLLYGQIAGQTWSHLILTGLNEGVWPRPPTADPFGSRHDLAQLNARIARLNRGGTTEGAQGRGHDTVAPGHAHCLLPLERQELALRDLCLTLEATSSALALVAITTHEGRSLLPSDFFSFAYTARTGHVLDEIAFHTLAQSTADWCRKHAKLFPRPDAAAPSSITATRRAYDARRDSSAPFGPFEFAFAQPPPHPTQLPCQRWEDALQHPAQVWLTGIVSVPSWPEGSVQWSRAIGTWVHRWLSRALEECRERNTVADFLPLLREAAGRELTRTRERAATSGLRLYPWWPHVWGQARAVALGLGETLAPCLADRQFLPEFRLPDGCVVALPGSPHADFQLTGRIDLLLVEGAVPLDRAAPALAGRACWIVDFKTGSAKELNLKQLAQGRGLQVVLYMLAVEPLGAATTTASLHTPTAPLKAQLDLREAREQTGLFRSLDILHREGRFGLRQTQDAEYAYTPGLPMATRPIPAEILHAKWELVHGPPAAAPEEDA